MDWEYFVMVLEPTNGPGLANGDHSVLLEVLNAKGHQGWELVSVVPDVKGLDYLAYYFKRPTSA
jgi:uncharacterized protein DUF4177